MTVLLTGAGAPGAAGIIKCIRAGDPGIRIAGVDMNAFVYGRALADSFHTVPRAEAPDFIASVSRICKDEHVDMIIPIVTRELPVFAAAKKYFLGQGVQVCVLDEETLETANDKYLLLKKLREKRIRTPEFFYCRQFDEVRKAFADLGYPHNDVCFKPVVSNGSRGFRIISERIDENKLLFEEKPQALYMTYEKMVSILGQNAFPPLLVMEYLPGTEYSMDCLADRGKTLYCIPRRRNRMNGGISVDATVVNDHSVVELGTAICEALNLHGNIGIQCKLDSKGVPQVLEINPRLQGTTVISAAAGVNLPYYGILLAQGKAIPSVEPEWDIRMCRYWEEVYFDAGGQPFSYPVL